MAKNYWLMKTEPDVFSIQDLEARPDQTEPWDGIRNYQARNFMRDGMKQGDAVLFYHSSAGDESGAVGLAEIASDGARPDPSSWNPKSKYYDEKAKPEIPRWVMVDVKWKARFPKLVSLAQMKADPELEGMLVVKRGQRLSIQPVEKKHFERVCRMGGLSARELKELLA